MSDTTLCQRCGDACVATPVNKDSSARPFKRALRGLCTPCVVCAFFQDDNVERGLGFALGAGFKPEHLRLPHVQQQFARVLKVGASELTMDQIDWDQVIQKWDLSKAERGVIN